jgi:hypothetical protein
MYESIKERDAALKFDAVKRGPVEKSIGTFFRSLAQRVHLWPSAAKRQPNLVIKQGRFDWGSFAAFADGSIEIERAGVKQTFKNFSDLKRSLNYASKAGESATESTASIAPLES